MTIRFPGRGVAGVPGIRRRSVFGPWAELLLDVVGIAPGSRVLDIASETGVVSRAAARRAGGEGHVVASDVSGPMLAHAASILAPHGVAAY